MIFLFFLKFMFSKKTSKIDEIFTVYVANVKSTVKILSTFVAFLENMNFSLILEGIDLILKKYAKSPVP